MSTSRRRRLLILAIALAVAGAGIWGAIVAFPSSSSSPTCTLGPPTGLSRDQAQLLVPCSTTVTLPPHSFVSYTMVRLSDQMTAVGQFVATGATNGTFGAFLINSSELSTLLANPSPQQLPSDYFWSSGPGPVCNVTQAIPPSPGQYYIVVVNAGPTAVSLEWPFGLVLYYRPV